MERLDLALEPQEPYERNDLTGGGVEDPRITLIDPLQRSVVTYTAFGPQGPRIALAISPDLQRWERLGLLHFAPTGNLDAAGIDLNGCPNMAWLIRGSARHGSRSRPFPRRCEASVGRFWDAALL